MLHIQFIKQNLNFSYLLKILFDTRNYLFSSYWQKPICICSMPVCSIMKQRTLGLISYLLNGEQSRHIKLIIFFFLSNKSWPENVKWVVPILILFGCNLVGPRKTKATCYYFPKLGQVDPPYSVLYIQSLQFCKDQATVQPFNILKSVPLNFSISLSRFIKGGMNIIDLLGILPYFMSLSLNLVTTRTR